MASDVDDLFQKLRHPKSKEKRSENNSRLVVGSLKYLINANICTVYSWTGFVNGQTLITATSFLQMFPIS